MRTTSTISVCKLNEICCYVYLAAHLDLCHQRYGVKNLIISNRSMGFKGYPYAQPMAHNYLPQLQD